MLNKTVKYALAFLAFFAIAGIIVYAQGEYNVSLGNQIGNVNISDIATRTFVAQTVNYTVVNYSIDQDIAAERITTNMSVNNIIQIENASWLSTYNATYAASGNASWNETRGTQVFVQLSNTTLNALIGQNVSLYTTAQSKYNATYAIIQTGGIISPDINITNNKWGTCTWRNNLPRGTTGAMCNDGEYLAGINMTSGTVYNITKIYCCLI